MKTYRPVLDKRTRQTPPAGTWFFLPLTEEEQGHITTRTRRAKWARIELSFGAYTADSHWDYARVSQGGEPVATILRYDSRGGGFHDLRGSGRLLTEEEYHERHTRAIALHRSWPEGFDDYGKASELIGRPVPSFLMLHEHEFRVCESWVKSQRGAEEYGGPKSQLDEMKEEMEEKGATPIDVWCGRILGSRAVDPADLSPGARGDVLRRVRWLHSVGRIGQDRAPGQPMRGTRSRAA